MCSCDVKNKKKSFYQMGNCIYYVNNKSLNKSAALSALFDAQVHFPLYGLFDGIDFLQNCRHRIDEFVT